MVRGLLPLPAAGEAGGEEEREKRREEAGCMLWDLTAVPMHASFLVENALLPEVRSKGPSRGIGALVGCESPSGRCAVSSEYTPCPAMLATDAGYRGPFSSRIEFWRRTATRAVTAAPPVSNSTRDCDSPLPLTGLSRRPRKGPRQRPPCQPKRPSKARRRDGRGRLPSLLVLPSVPPTNDATCRDSHSPRPRALSPHPREISLGCLANLVSCPACQTRLAATDGLARSFPPHPPLAVATAGGLPFVCVCCCKARRAHPRPALAPARSRSKRWLQRASWARMTLRPSPKPAGVGHLLLLGPTAMKISAATTVTHPVL